MQDQTEVIRRKAALTVRQSRREQDSLRIRSRISHIDTSDGTVKWHVDVDLAIDLILALTEWAADQDRWLRMQAERRVCDVFRVARIEVAIRALQDAISEMR